jgi:hypothetical protein
LEDLVMGNLFRKKKIASRINERNFPFVVQVPVPDVGFGPTLDAINAWHCYSKHRQRRGHRQHLGEQHFWRWCFESVEVAERFQRRFGGEIVHLVIEPRAARRRDPALQIERADNPGVPS